MLHPGLAHLWRASEMAVEAFGTVEAPQSWLFASQVSDLIALGLTEPQLHLLQAKGLLNVRCEPILGTESLLNGEPSSNGHSHPGADPDLLAKAYSASLPSPFAGEGPVVKRLNPNTLILLTPHGIQSLSAMLNALNTGSAFALHPTSSTTPVAMPAAPSLRHIVLPPRAVESRNDEIPSPLSPVPSSLIPSVKPHYNADLRELWYAGHLIKRYRTPAKNQELILLAFEEESWPQRIDDPLPPAQGIDPKLRLRDTITQLNRHQNGSRMRFHGDGIGSGVKWQTNGDCRH
jgi:hypothetical protein